jgi:pimeloyl-ACP methyl ester carboxylesterase
MTAAAGGFIEVGGRRVFIQQWGSGPALLCLHGLGGGTHFFSELGPLLSARHRTVAFDFPGAGQSPSTLPITFDGFGEIVVALAASLNASGLTLLAHSMGTIIGLEAIRASPHLASRFIAVGGVPEPPDSARARISARIGAIRASGISGLGKDAVAGNVSARTKATRPDVTARLAEDFDRQSGDGYVGIADALVGWTARPLPPLDGVKCLAITGEEDRYAPPDAMRKFAGQLPEGTRFEVMRDCGHLPFLEQPEAFAEIVERFLDEPPYRVISVQRTSE